MIPVKVCGITRLEDALLCARLGARAVGFVFYGRSPRAISPGAAREIARRLPPQVKKVGVFVNAKPETMMEVAARVGLDMVQLSGDEPPEVAAAVRGVRVVKAFRLARMRDLERIKDYTAVHAILVDAATQGHYGGTGICADWELARQATRYGKPVILAGGLNGGNVTLAIRTVRPSGLDVCTGVEAEPGIKDERKLRAFFDVIWESSDRIAKLVGLPARPGGEVVAEVRAASDLSPAELLARARGEGKGGGAAGSARPAGDASGEQGGARDPLLDAPLLDELPPA